MAGHAEFVFCEQSIERTLLGWSIPSRHLGEDHERMARTSETFIEVAMIYRLLLLLSRLAKGA